jgi:ABC-type transport system involved in cytochrome c biogenesis permease subunit
MGPFVAVLLAASAALYTLAGISHLFYMARRPFEFLAKWSTRVAFTVHTLGLAALIIHTGHAPLHEYYEFAYLFTWVLMANYTAIEIWRKNQAAGAFLVPVIAVLQVMVAALPKNTPQHLGVELSPSLIGWHVGVTFLGYGFFFGSFVSGALYLLQERNLRAKRWGPLYYRLPSLEALDIWGGRFVYVGFPLLTVGMAAGLMFAHVTWQSFWQSDPKVIFTVFVWAVYGLYLLMRNVWGWGGRRAAWWSVAGVAGLLINYFVMNLLSGIHRFGV